MGLDMFAYRIRKCTEEEIKSIIEEGRVPSHINAVDAETVTENYSAFSDLEEIMTKVSYIDVDAIDLTKVKKLNGVPEDAYIGMKSWHGDSITFGFRNDGFSKDVTVTPDDFEKYQLTEPITVYVFCLEEVGYWRKAYDLQDQIHDAYDGYIENCGYHYCNEDMLQAMLDYDKVDGGSGRTDGSFTVDSDDIYYHEWY